jgi:AcrR family transcriptional regulator
MRAAARLFRERGYERTRLTDIADALNISKPSLYYYLGDKEGILIAIQQFGLDQMLDGFDLLVDRGATGAELVRILLTRYGEWTTTEFGVCVITSFNIKISPRGAKSLHAARRLLERKVRALIERGIADGSIRPCTPGAGCHGPVRMPELDGLWYDRSRARHSAADISSQFVDYFLSGLNGPGTAKAREPTLAKERKRPAV